jgi:hypothetical protein
MPAPSGVTPRRWVFLLYVLRGREKRRGPQLTTKQADAFRNKIRPMLYLLFRCRRRLDAPGFDQKGSIDEAVDKAYSAMHELHITLHYHLCGRGVGRRHEK